MADFENEVQELQEELDAIKAINQKIQLEKNELKEQLRIAVVVKSLPDGDDVWCKASEMSRDNFTDWYDTL